MFRLNFVLENEASKANFNLNKRILVQSAFSHWAYVKSDYNMYLPELIWSVLLFKYFSS